MNLRQEALGHVRGPIAFQLVLVEHNLFSWYRGCWLLREGNRVALEGRNMSWIDSTTLYESYMSSYLGQTLRGIRGIGEGFRSILVRHSEGYIIDSKS